MKFKIKSFSNADAVESELDSLMDNAKSLIHICKEDSSKLNSERLYKDLCEVNDLLEDILDSIQ